MPRGIAREHRRRGRAPALASISARSSTEPTCAVHQGGRRLGVAAAQRLDDLAMLGDGAFRANAGGRRARGSASSATPPRRGSAAAAALPDISASLMWNSPARRIDTRASSARLGLILLAHVAFEDGAEFRLPARDDEADHLALERAAHLEHRPWPLRATAAPPSRCACGRPRRALRAGAAPASRGRACGSCRTARRSTSSGSFVPGGSACSMIAWRSA